MYKNTIVKPFISINSPSKIYYGFVETPKYGRLFLAFYLEKNLYLCYAHFAANETTMEKFKNDLQILWPKTEIVNDDKTTKEIWDKYMTEPNGAEEIYVLLKGTEFQRKVWSALLEIPFGEECTYSDLAVAIGNPKAVRAVANAVGSNNIAIFIPCHRVKAKNGDKLKYRWGGDLKKRILVHEKGNV
ncbi:methylated-DNA--protein-cysteine methyltransferase [Lucilia sericata]|uniref:methylated-DNA--protein-cysteine methyltransferase n=1 Tax=Lucilia sericata TaxID=13632 RepID=UPI0018A81798|nr:methylated-DNA--protein-cysteine methyltransferase [Lucilia sericata]